MKLELAFVNFFKEARGRRIVQVKDILEFSPKFHDNFDEDKTYQVKWAHFPNDTSFSTEGSYEAKILCLGVDYDDLVHEAKRRGLKLPNARAAITSEGSPKKKTPIKSLRGRTLRQCSTTDKKEPSVPNARPKKKKKSSQEVESAKEKRIKKIIYNYSDPCQTDNNSDGDDEHQSLSRHIKIDQRKETNPTIVFPKKSSPVKQVKYSPLKVREESSTKSGGQELLAEDVKAQKKKSSQEVESAKEKRIKKIIYNYSDSCQTDDNSDGDDEHQSLSRHIKIDQRKETNPTIVFPKKSSPVKQVKYSPLKVREESSTKSGGQELLAEDVKAQSPLQSSHSRETKETKRFSSLFDWNRTNASLKQDRDNSETESWLNQAKSWSFSSEKLPKSTKEDAMSFTQSKPKPMSSCDVVGKRTSHFKKKTDEVSTTTVSSTSDEYLPSDAEKDMFFNKMRILETDSKKMRSSLSLIEEKLKSTTDELKSAREKIQNLEQENLKLHRLNSNLTEKLMANMKPDSFKTPSPLKTPTLKRAGLKDDGALNPPNRIEHSLSDDDDLDVKKGSLDSDCARNVSLDDDCSPEKNDCKRKLIKEFDGGSSSKRKKDRLIDPREDGIASNDKLAPMILEAFGKNPELQSDGAGKSHLGNGVWISSSLFYEKIAKPKVSPSIALRDATTNLYTKQVLAERSLEGRTPVKDKTTKKKPKMTPQKRESLLALFRAKTMQTTGSRDKDYLDLMVQKKGRDTLRDKMKEAASADKKKKTKKTGDDSVSQAENQGN